MATNGITQYILASMGFYYFECITNYITALSNAKKVSLPYLEHRGLVGTVPSSLVTTSSCLQKVKPIEVKILKRISQHIISPIQHDKFLKASGSPQKKPDCSVYITYLAICSTTHCTSASFYSYQCTVPKIGLINPGDI